MPLQWVRLWAGALVLIGGCSGRPAQIEATQIRGRLRPEVIQSVVRRAFPSFATCYKLALPHDPKAAGKIVAEFVIDRDGLVSAATLTDATTFADPKTRECALSVFSVLVFPKPDGGIVKVVYPIMLSPG